ISMKASEEKLKINPKSPNKALKTDLDAVKNDNLLRLCLVIFSQEELVLNLENIRKICAERSFFSLADQMINFIEENPNYLKTLNLYLESNNLSSEENKLDDLFTSLIKEIEMDKEKAIEIDSLKKAEVI
ncbi:MAG: hypothetical protein MHPSP_000095, partial [Paramarteilia canceri]